MSESESPSGSSEPKAIENATSADQNGEVANGSAVIIDLNLHLVLS